MKNIVHTRNIYLNLPCSNPVLKRCQVLLEDSSIIGISKTLCARGNTSVKIFNPVQGNQNLYYQVQPGTL